MYRWMGGNVSLKVLKLFRRDISIGIYRNVLIFFIPMIVSIVQCCECHNLISYLNEENLLKAGGTILDYYMYCMQGMAVFHFDPRQYFTIPIYWFMFQICISYCIGYYSYQDFMQNGRNLFLAVKDRKSWWDSKCLWCMSVVLFYYIVFGISTILSAAYWGAEWKLSYTVDFVTRVFDANVAYMSNAEIVLISVILPCVVTIGLCLFQILFGFFTTPVVSFACMCGVYVLSAYYTDWFLLGNYTMWLRSTYLTAEGVNPFSGLILGVNLSVCVWYTGRMYFGDKDIL